MVSGREATCGSTIAVGAMESESAVLSFEVFELLDEQAQKMVKNDIRVALFSVMLY